MRTIRQAGCSIYPTRLFIHKHVLMPEPDREGKGKAREPITQDGPSGPVKPETQSPPTQPVPSPSSEVPTTSSSSEATTAKPTKPAADPLSDYTCPICFPAPTNATITPCDHICCGSCLFAAAKAGYSACGDGTPSWGEWRAGGTSGMVCSALVFLVVCDSQCTF